MIRTTVRRTSRLRWCQECHAVIPVGERYREAVASPGHGDLGNLSWWRLVECLSCAATHPNTGVA